MRRKRIFIVAMVLFVATSWVSADIASGVFFDDFDDGDADGWWLYNGEPPRENRDPEWSVPNGSLLQSGEGDHILGLVENLPISD